MNPFGRLLTELKGTIAERMWGTCAQILLWLQLRRLTTALDQLFTAWRDGTLPPQPAPAPPPAPSVQMPSPRAPRCYGLARRRNFWADQ